jgi:tetratricopeptide (TPR) repeat protein
MARSGYYLHHRAAYDLAEPLYQRTLSIFEKALGPDHPNTGITIANIANLWATSGRLEDALPLARRALAIFARALGDAHPHTKATAQFVQMIEAAIAAKEA